MAQKQIYLKTLEKGMTLSLGDNVSLHLFMSEDGEVYIKLRREDARKGRVFILSVDQWEEMNKIRDTVNNWLLCVKSV